MCIRDKQHVAYLQLKCGGLGSWDADRCDVIQVEAPPLHVGDSKVRHLDVGRVVLLPNVFGDTANDSRDVL